MVVAACCFSSVSYLLTQFAAAEASHWSAVFITSLVGGSIAIPLVLFRRGKAHFYSHNYRLLLLRGLVGVALIAALFAALATIPLTEAILFRQTAPLWIPILSLVLLGEAMPRRLWPLLICGIAGVALILHPKLGTIGLGYLYGLAAGLLFALQTILTRSLNQKQEPWDRILFYVYSVAILSSLIPAAPTLAQTGVQAVWLLLVSGLGLLASTACLIVAFGRAKAWFLGPLGYTAVVFAALLDWIVLKHLPDLETATGMLLVIGSGVFILRLGAAVHRCSSDRRQAPH